MLLQESVEAYCPYCGEPIQLIVDCSIPDQDYIEDCQVCCRPIELKVQVDSEGIPALTAHNETE